VTTVASIISDHDLGRYRTEIPGLGGDAVFRRFVETFSAEIKKPSPLGVAEDYFEAIDAAEVIEASTCALSAPELHADVLEAYAVRLERYRRQLEYLASDNDFRHWVGRVAALEQLSFVLKAASGSGIDTQQLTVWAHQRPAAEGLDPAELHRLSSDECEARLVELRIDYTPNQARAECPSVTAFLRDVPYRDQIISKSKALPPTAPGNPSERRAAGMTLGDIIHHPALFSGLPDLAKLPVRLFDAIALDNADLASYREDEHGRGLIEVATGAPEKELRRALLREMQRAIQRIEAGAGPEPLTSAITLHDLLLRDEGADLPIRGGFGQSRDEPIVVDHSDPELVGETQMLVLRGLSRGRGIFWRCLARNLLGDKWPGIEQFKIETVELTASKLITQTENYYFDLSGMIAGGATGTHSAPICYYDNSGLCFPYEIGWLHFNDIIDNEPQAPGLGVTLRYGAPGIKGTVFVYDRQRRDIPSNINDPWVQAEFEEASVAATMRSEVAPWPEPLPNGAYLVRYWALGDDAQDATVLWMAVARGKLVKARLTWHRDDFLDKVGNGFLRSLLVSIGKSN
jgi:hypothetical protein